MDFPKPRPLLLAALAMQAAMLFPGMPAPADGTYPLQQDARVDRIFVPARGYDDNDEVRFVLDGRLPNNCWAPGETRIARDPGSPVFRVRQLAIRRTVKICASGDAFLPAAWRLPVRFTQEASLGRLRASRYFILSKGPDFELPIRGFDVDRAPVSAQDDFAYADVSNAYVTDGSPSRQPVTAVLTGSLPGSCMELDGEPEVWLEDDVVVVLPKLRARPGACDPAEASFEKEVVLGSLAPGRYLLHVRSSGGRVLERVFTVR